MNEEEAAARDRSTIRMHTSELISSDSQLIAAGSSYLSSVAVVESTAAEFKVIFDLYGHTVLNTAAIPVFDMLTSRNSMLTVGSLVLVLGHYLMGTVDFPMMRLCVSHNDKVLLIGNEGIPYLMPSSIEARFFEVSIRLRRKFEHVPNALASKDFEEYPILSEFPDGALVPPVRTVKAENMKYRILALKQNALLRSRGLHQIIAQRIDQPHSQIDMVCDIKAFYSELREKHSWD